MKRVYTIQAIRKIVLCCLLFFSAISFLQAQVVWRGTTSNKWSVASNWSPAKVPTSTDDVVIGSSSISNQPTVDVSAVCKSLTVGGTYTSTLTVNYPLSVSGNVTINSNGTLNHGYSQTLTLTGNWTCSGNYVGQYTSTVVFAGATQTINGSNVDFKNLTINAGSTALLNANVSADVSVLVNGTWDPNEGTATYLLSGSAAATVGATGTAKVKAAAATSNYMITGGVTILQGGTVDYASTTVTQTIYSNFAYDNLKISGSGTKQLSGDYAAWYTAGVDVGNVTVMAGCTLDLYSYSLSRGNTGGTLTINNGATLRIGGTNSLPVFMNYSFGTTSTVEYYGTSQTITPGTYGNLWITSAGTKTAGGVLTVNDIVITTATFAGGYYTHKITSDWLMTSGSFNNTGTTIQFTGTGAQTISSTGAFSTLNINKASGTTNLLSDITASTLSFTKGNITTNAYKVIIPSGGAVSGAGQSTGWVNGRLQRYVSTTTPTFAVGTASYYSPVSLTLASLTTAGNLIVGCTDGSHPNISTSTISAKNISAYWTISKPASGAVAFSTTSAAFAWNVAENYSPVDPTALKAALYNGSAWSYPTVSGTSTTTSLTVTGVAQASLGDFAIGETCAATPNFSYAGSPYCLSGTATVTFSNGGSAGAFTASPAGLTLNSATGAVTLSTSTPGTYTVTNSVGTGACATSYNATIVINANVGTPVFSLGASSSRCIGAATVTYSATAGNATGISYSLDATSLAAGNKIVATTGAVTFTAGWTGTATITATASGCSGPVSATHTVTTSNVVATPVFSLGSSSSRCMGAGTVAYTATANYATGITYSLDATSLAAGNSINTATGAVTYVSTWSGTSTITATATGCSGPKTATHTVTTTAAPSATISYTGSPFSTYVGGSQSVTRTGTAGGTFSAAPAGLSIDATTGTIVPSTSAAGSYTVTYTIAAAGGCAVYTTTTNVTVYVPITKYYVNDNSNTGNVYTSAVGSDANAGTAAAPFLTINKAIAVAKAGDTVYVDAGTYTELVNASKQITLLGANAAISPNSGTRNAETVLNNASGNSINITTTSKVLIKGFKVITSAAQPVVSTTANHVVSLEKNLFDGSRELNFVNGDSLYVIDNKFTNISSGNDRAIYVQGDYNGTAGTDVEVYNNSFVNSASGGMNISNAKGNIYNNTFSSIAYSGLAISNYSSINIYQNTFSNISNPDVSVKTQGAGIRFSTPAAGMTTTITSNVFTNNYVGVATMSTDNVANANLTINNNSFTGNTYANINHTGTGLLAATCNWFGAANGGAFASTILGTVNMSPFLSSGTDNDAATPGFQPVANTCTNYLQRWTGAVSTDWKTVGNWAGGNPSKVPDDKVDVIIPSGLSVYPAIPASINDAKVEDLTVSSGASLTLLGTLTVSGNIVSSNGIIADNGGTIIMKGSAAQTISANAFASEISNLTVDNKVGVSLLGKVKLNDALTIKNGALTSNGNLILRSTAVRTARVAPITSTAVTPVIGDVTVERYVAGRRKYRLITSAVTTSTSSVLTAGQETRSIWGNWQNSGSNATAGVGTFITGGTSAAGYDTQTTSASLYTYNDITRKFVAFSSANGKNTKYTPLVAGVPYYMFVYGDRTNTISTPNPNNTTLSATGTLTTGDITYTTTTSPIRLADTVGKYTLLGNPYASPINWASVTKKDLDAICWSWDPNLGSTGGYVTINATLSGTILISPISVKVKLDQYIQSGQAFFVRTKGANPSLTISENDKVVNVNNLAFRTTDATGSTGTPNSIPLMAVNLLYTSGGSEVFADGALAAFDNVFTNTVSEEDAVKVAGTAEAVSIENGGQLLSIDARSKEVVKDTLNLNLSKLTKTQYTLEIFAQKMAGSSVQAFLNDRYLKTSRPLSLTDTNSVVININPADSASFDQRRFYISLVNLTTLPVNYTAVLAMQEGKNVQVQWNVSVENNMSRYQVEKSTNGADFTVVGDVKAQGFSDSHQYSWMDVSPAAGYNYYRVRGIDASGKTYLTKVVGVKLNGGDAPSVTVSPNPVKDQQINLQISNIEKGAYTATLYDPQGKEVYQTAINYSGGFLYQVLQPQKQLAAGMYYLTLSNKSKKYDVRIIME